MRKGWSTKSKWEKGWSTKSKWEKGDKLNQNEKRVIN